MPGSLFSARRVSVIRYQGFQSAVLGANPCVSVPAKHGWTWFLKRFILRALNGLHNGSAFMRLRIATFVAAMLLAAARIPHVSHSTASPSALLLDEDQA